MFINITFILLCQVGQFSSQYVVCAMNPIVRIGVQVVVFMVGAFIFMMLDFYFLGQTYIIVYVGAIAIQFQFVIMMVNIPIISTETIFSYRPTYAKSLKIENKKSINIFKYKAIAEIKQYNFEIPSIRTEEYNEIIKSVDSNSYTTTISSIQDADNMLITYFNPIWSIEFKTIVDQDTLGQMTYMAYPTAQIQIGIALWAVQIGVISICGASAPGASARKNWGFSFFIVPVEYYNNLFKMSMDYQTYIGDMNDYIILFIITIFVYIQFFGNSIQKRDIIFSIILTMIQSQYFNIAIIVFIIAQCGLFNCFKQYIKKETRHIQVYYMRDITINQNSILSKFYFCMLISIFILNIKFNAINFNVIEQGIIKGSSFISSESGSIIDEDVKQIRDEDLANNKRRVRRAQWINTSFLQPSTSATGSAFGSTYVDGYTADESASDSDSGSASVSASVSASATADVEDTFISTTADASATVSGTAAYETTITEAYYPTPNVTPTPKTQDENLKTPDQDLDLDREIWVNGQKGWKSYRNSEFAGRDYVPTENASRIRRVLF